MEDGAAAAGCRPSPRRELRSAPAGRTLHCAVGSGVDATDVQCRAPLRRFDTTTLTAVEGAILPGASRAAACSRCVPLLALVVSHATVYGAVVTCVPNATPSR